MRAPLPSFRRWCDARPWTRIAWAATVNVCVIFYGFYMLTWAPVATLVACLKLSRHVGHGSSETVLLGLGAKVAMGLVVVAALLLSSALAGFMRALFRGGMFDRAWVMAAFMPALVGLLIWVGYVVRHASSLIATAGGDNLLIVAFLTAWLLPLGYAAKVPWDEFRDRCASYVEQKWTLRD